MKSNLKKSVFNKRKMRDLFNSYSTNLDLIKSLCEESESEKYNKVSVFLLHSFLFDIFVDMFLVVVVMIVIVDY